MKTTISILISMMFCMSLMAQMPQKSAVKLNKNLNLKKVKNFAKPENINSHQLIYKHKNFVYNGIKQKSAETIKQRLDSVIYKGLNSFGSWVTSYKESYTYDSKGNETAESYFEWDITTGKLVSAEKGEFTLDSKGNYTLNVWYDWDDIAKKWVGSYKSESIYDLNGNRTLYVSYDWDALTSKWVGSYKTENTYNASGNTIIRISYNWDLTVNKWVGQSKDETTYNLNGIPTLTHHYTWNETYSLWENYAKSEYVYDANGNSILETWFDKRLASWVAIQKTEYAYDSNGNMTLYTYYYFNEVTNKWDGSYKWESVFDSNGHEILSISYDWDIYTEKWVADYKYETAFDSNGNLILEIDYERDEMTNLLVADYKTVPTWNNAYTEFIMPEESYDVTIFKHMLTGYDGYTWNADASQWELTEKATFYYSEQDITGIQENTENLVTIYPNPATDFLTFTFKDASQPALVELFDMQGKLLISRDIYHNQQLPVSHLQTGMYFCKVSQNGVQFNSKLLIK